MEAKIDFETKLERDIDLRFIFDGFWYHKSLKIGFKIDDKVMLNTKSFSRQFWGAECPSLSRSDPPQNDVQGEGMREPKEGVTMSHASQAPVHGVGG